VRCARSLAEDRLAIKIGKDRGQIQVSLCADAHVPAGLGIYRNDCLYPDPVFPALVR
jgi:hypothetical protein